MKNGIFFFVLIAFLCLIDHLPASQNLARENDGLADFNPGLIMEPPMDLSQDLPVTISMANRRAFITNDKVAQDAAVYNKEMLRAKTIPWQFFSVLITLLVLIMILKYPVQMNK